MDIDEDFGNWFAGFTDGEGSFTVRVSKRKGTEYVEISPSFSIILRKDDTAILQEIRSKLGIPARLKFYGVMINKQGVRSNPRVMLEIRRREQCLRLVEIFDRFPLRAKKRRDFAIWRELLLTWKATPRGNKWHGFSDRTRILELVKQLRDGRKYRGD